MASTSPGYGITIRIEGPPASQPVALATTVIAAAGPIFPRPKTADPSVTTATVLRLIVRRRASEGSSTIAWQIRATPGV